MAKNKILLSTLIYSAVDPAPYASHLNAFYRFGRDLPEWEFVFHSPWRLPIDAARNQAVQAALEYECEWLFFFDSDMILSPAVIRTLLEREKPMVMANCLIRGYPYEPMIFRYADESKKALLKYVPTDEDRKQEVIQADAVGTACTVIHCELFKHMEEPWFLTGKYHTEDVYFCVKAAAEVQGFSCWVDLTVEAGHLLNPFVLTSSNAPHLREFWEKGFNELGLVEPKNRKDQTRVNPLEGSALCI